MRLLVWRVVRAGLVAAAAVWVAGWGLERIRFGGSDAAALTRVEAELRQRFEASADALGAMATSVAEQRETIRRAPRDDGAARRLFEAVAAAVPDEDAGRTGLTVYDAAAAPVAWDGSVSDLPRDRVNGPPALFVAPGALGPRLVRVEPVTDPGAARAPRLGTIVVEQLLGTITGPPAPPDASFVVSTSLAPVTLRAAASPGAPMPPPAPPGPVPLHTFVINARSGEPLVVASVSPQDVAAGRDRVRAMRWAAVLFVFAVTLVLCMGPLVEWRRRTRDAAGFAAATLALVVAIVAARAVLWYAAVPFASARGLASPAGLLFDALAAAALVWMAFDAVSRRRVAPPRPHLLTGGSAAALRVAAGFAAAAVLGSALLAAYERFVRAIVSQARLDVLHFSLHPISGTRLAVAFALLLLHASVIWGAVVLIRLAALGARTPRHGALPALAAAAWGAGVVGAWLVVRAQLPWLEPGPWLIAMLTAGACAVAVGRLHRRARRRSQAARLATLFLALLLPALAMYPSLLADAIASKERLVADELSPMALSLRDDLQVRLRHALDQIDAMPAIERFVSGDGGSATPATDRAFVVWSQTDLATYRLTSAVELYGADGRLVSRFALNLPEYTTTRHVAASCAWDLFDEVSPFGSSERRVLNATRGVCRGGRVLGTIVVRVMLDYQTLPFISSQSPYLESLRPESQAPPESAPGRDVEFVVYGWSRAPLYASGTSVWPLPDAIFERMVATRRPFWTTLVRDGDEFRVHFANDRGGIYALGYPVITGFGHLVNLAELVTLCGVLYLLLLAAGTLLDALTSRTPASGRALLREIRSSFYRRLFLAFVSAAVVPVVILAVAVRTYFAAEFRAGIEEAAARTAAVAERLVEDYATLQQRGAGALETIDDQIMVLVGRAIDEDVNLFDRARLQATSERDLFASRLLSTRAPGDVFRAITLDRLPTYVGVEQVGDFRYLLAAAPVRAGDREGIVTVPVTLRQQEIEQQIDQLDRRVLFAAVLFVLFGSAVGYWMAERIADPVNRLSRATRRITHGDLDAHAAATSADELGRLIGDFNEMARELKRQRAELERTQRLEAWADMARQVAHDIKNPLTPIQLSAEHARRINADRGRPLSPVLDSCVDAILSQVRLLRQIAAEFSSFASSPTPRPESTTLPALLDEVLEPYRAGLSGRIGIDVRADEGLPPVTIDRTLFGRALTNVIENALHAMPGGGRLSIHAFEDRRDGAGRALVVEVRDNGVGMDPEALARIFEPYFSTKATGTGLGLTIARRNIELVGGSIEVESQRGVGTTVTMRLPVT